MRSGVLVAVLFASVTTYADDVARNPLASADGVVHEKALCHGGTFRCFAHVVTDERGNVKSSFVPFGYGPPDLQSAYNIDVSKDPHATVAIVDAYGYPTLEADLAAYRTQFGLPPCTIANGCLQILNTAGNPSPLPGNAPAGDDWTGETALDMDMVSAGCPLCKIIVVQADNDFGTGLIVGNTTAAQKGAQFVSNSWGQSEPSSQTIGQVDPNFNHPGTIYFASTGDEGYLGTNAQYPASSQHVFAVGGTTLNEDVTGVRGWKETAWGGGNSGAGGSSCSRSIAKPAYQTSDACAKRMTSDLSAVGDPATGVAVFNNGQWGVVGGTSASSPLIAAIFAQAGLVSATADYPYTNAANFYDVTSGTNGSCGGGILCTSGVGWDGPTGIGTPNTAMLAGAKAPTLSVTPGDAAAVPPGFEIDVDCTSNDSATIKQVDIFLDGGHFGKLTMAPFTKNAPTTFANGKHTVQVFCTTSTGAVAQTAIFSVTQAPPCSVDSDCPAVTDVCFDGACIAGPDGPGGLGSVCKADGDCVSGMCASDGTDHFCVVGCDPTANDCPNNFQCLAAGASGVCWPGADNGGDGGCNTDAGGNSTAPLLLGISLLGFAIVRRRS